MRPRQFLHATVLVVALTMTALGSASAESCTGKGKKACEVPETPYVAIIPAMTMASVAGLYLIRRRRSSLMAEVDATK
jgi:hypothetical protein